MTDEPIDEPAVDDAQQVEEPLVETAPPPPPLVSLADELALEAEKQRQLELENDERIAREVSRLSRRGFLTAAVAAGTSYGAWKWLTTSKQMDYLHWPLRRVLRMNESVAEAYFREARLSPTFPTSRITRPAKLNGNLGLDPNFDPSTWQLRVEGAAKPVVLTLDDIKSLPRREQITEFRCIEGWSMIVKWTGTRLADIMAKFPPPDRVQYVGMETPDRGYYVGLDMQSAMHPQTLLAYALNDEPLSAGHGAPLRLAIPVKYGIKNIKRIGTIRYTNVRPADFWAEQGYDWYAGH
ncbi:MAG TPA: molybdopterin-dependent oxidoreductase [Thermoanaerobaculia bacterium]